MINISLRTCEDTIIKCLPRQNFILRQKRWTPNVSGERTQAQSAYNYNETDLYFFIVTSIHNHSNSIEKVYCDLSAFQTISHDSEWVPVSTGHCRWSERRPKKRCINLLTQTYRLFSLFPFPLPSSTPCRPTVLSFYVARKGWALRSGVEIAYALVYRVTSTRQQDVTDIGVGVSDEHRADSISVTICINSLTLSSAVFLIVSTVVTNNFVNCSQIIYTLTNNFCESYYINSFEFKFLWI